MPQLSLGALSDSHFSESVRQDCEAIKDEPLFGLTFPWEMDSETSEKLKSRVPQAAAWLAVHSQASKEFAKRIQAIREAMEYGSRLDDSYRYAEAAFEYKMVSRCPGLLSAVARAQAEFLLRHINEGYQASQPDVRAARRSRAKLWEALANSSPACYKR